jgi:serine/threonine protein phosphatase 1
MTVKYLPHNSLGKDYIIGDLHGHADMLFDALDRVNFDPDIDRVIAVGDLIDRGPFNVECIMLLDQPWFHSVKGNHEQFAEHSHFHYVRQTWFKNGGSWAIHVLGTDEWMGYKDTLAALPTAIVVGDGANRYNVVHAEPHHHNGHMTDVSFDATPVPELEADVMWSRTLFTYPHVYKFSHNLSTTFVGHSPSNMLVKAGPIFFLDRNANNARWNPVACLAMACPQDRVIFEYYPPSDELITTPFDQVPDISHASFEEDYVTFKAPPPASA